MGLGRAGPHDLVLALAHLYVSKSSTGCLRPSARPEGSNGGTITHYVSIVPVTASVNSVLNFGLPQLVYPLKCCPFINL